MNSIDVAGICRSEERKATADAIAARLEIARSRGLITAIENRRPPTLSTVPDAPPAQVEEARSQLNGQYLDYLAKLTQLDGEIARYSKALPLAQERAHSYQELAKTHDVPGNASSEKLQAVIDLEGQLVQAQNAGEPHCTDATPSARCADGGGESCLERDAR